MIIGKNIVLRTLELSDLDFLYQLENDTQNWLISQTLVPFSKEILRQYIQSAQDIFLTKQVRFVIEKNNTQVGTVDLFDFDATNRRAGVGIAVLPEYRRQHIAQEAIELVMGYSFNTLLLHQLYCTILKSNTPSIKLFTQCGFLQTGEKKDWINTPNGWETALFFQKMKS